MKFTWPCGGILDALPGDTLQKDALIEKFEELRDFLKGVCGRMSRITDEPYFTYSAYNALTSGIQVKCPKCHGAGVW